jgi:hypothetical protein
MTDPGIEHQTYHVRVWHPKSRKSERGYALQLLASTPSHVPPIHHPNGSETVEDKLARLEGELELTRVTLLSTMASVKSVEDRTESSLGENQESLDKLAAVMDSIRAEAHTDPPPLGTWTLVKHDQ